MRLEDLQPGMPVMFQCIATDRHVHGVISPHWDPAQNDNSRVYVHHPDTGQRIGLEPVERLQPWDPTEAQVALIECLDDVRKILGRARAAAFEGDILHAVNEMRAALVGINKVTTEVVQD